MTVVGGTRAGAAVAAVTVLSALLAGCGVPLPPESPGAAEQGREDDAPGGDDVDRLEPRDDGSDALAEALLVLSARLSEARELLLAAEPPSADGSEGEDDADGAGPAARRARTGEEAVAVLLGVPGGGTAPGVLPAIEPDRAVDGSDDLVTALVTLAGDVGGERSRLVLEVVRDPILGDLGAWQRDPVGVIAVLSAVAARTAGDSAAAADELIRTAAELDAVLLELPGELTRALGYALVVATTDDDALAAHAAEQAAGRIGVVLVAIELAVERLGRSS